MTEPVDFQTAASIAAGENADSLIKGHLPLAEVVIAGPNERMSLHKP